MDSGQNVADNERQSILIEPDFDSNALVLFVNTESSAAKILLQSFGHQFFDGFDGDHQLQNVECWVNSLIQKAAQRREGRQDDFFVCIFQKGAVQSKVNV